MAFPVADRAPTIPTGTRESLETFFRELPADAAAREYICTHLHRLVTTMSLVPVAAPNGVARALELGAYMQMTPALAAVCGYAEVRGADFGPRGETVRKTLSLRSGEFTCDIDLFDAERDTFPYPDGHFAVVLCCEMIEHLLLDPMHMLLEIRRVLKPGGKLILTTPNCASLTSLACALHGRHNPQIYACYSRNPTDGRPHVREYTAYELQQLLIAGGFAVESLFTERIPGADEANWVRDLLRRSQMDESLRGEQTYCVAGLSEAGRVERYPSWLYC